MKSLLFARFSLLPLVLMFVSLVGCQSARQASEGSGLHQYSGTAGTAMLAKTAPAPERERPGVGTVWGEDRESSVHGRTFDRGDLTQPWSLGRFYYNDQPGARAMAAATGGGLSWRKNGPVVVADKALSVGLKDTHGNFLKSYAAGGNRIFIGDDGDRYTIFLRNQTNALLEVVVSVDGLDVLDGKRADWTKRGYVIRPRGSLEIEGFRQSLSRVATFRFGAVQDSYAALTSGDQNVGVIGIAVFPEKGVDPFRPLDRERWAAEPFQREFARPPREIH